MGLDEMVCQAAQGLNAPIPYQCMTRDDVRFLAAHRDDAAREDGAVALQHWSSQKNTGYFRFLQWKLRVVLLCLMESYDVVLVDVDVFVISPLFLRRLVN